MLIPGIYKHFKGGLYRLLFTVKNADDVSKDLVIYMSLETGEIWARSVEGWEHLVMWPDGRKCRRFIRWII